MQWLLLWLAAASGAVVLASPNSGDLDADATDRPPVLPAAREPRSAISLRWENDALADRDENYSNGISLAFSHEGRGWLGGVWDWFGASEGRRISSYELGQVIVTPADISLAPPDPQDRPYAGMLFGAVSTLYARDNQFHGLKFITGVVGPWSLAEEAQTWVHEMVGSTLPRGWDYQLENEPIFNLVYEHRRRVPILGQPGGWGAEAIPMVGGMLGNVLIQAQVCGQVRFGNNLPDDFGTTLMRGIGNLPFPRCGTDRSECRRHGAYVFAGGSGNLVARNLTLDGSTFRDSPSVDKEPAFASAELGLSVWFKHLQATFTYVIWGKEFEAQQAESRFGAITVSVFF
jgi:hypothetical protein